jgi:hypothetical protein
MQTLNHSLELLELEYFPPIMKGIWGQRIE